ncbi:MAG: DUF4157 domain-containing protein [Methylotetracoccus sp.]
MPTHAPPKESASQASRPFFGPQPARAAFFSAPDIQRECADREPETKVQPQLEVGSVDDPLEAEADLMADHVVRRKAAAIGDLPFAPATLSQSQPQPQSGGADIQTGSTPAVQRKCASCATEQRLQLKREVGPVDDPLELEADAMADQVVRRQADDTDDEGNDGMVQAKAEVAPSAESTSALDAGLARTHGSGSPLAPAVRDQMEDAFNADFSAVRVHTGSASAAMNDEIGARAFTYGTDIHFNEAQYSPGSDSGTHLLAHELTHVVQQNDDVRRAPKRVQRKPQLGPVVLGPKTGMPKGNLIHNEGLLPSFNKTPLNPGLWIEPVVPGANRDKVGPGLSGKPDFYRDKALDGRPIGINEGRLGGFSRIGPAVAAPQPPATPSGTVEDLDHAPVDIELGDVKPGLSGEEHKGRDQITNYGKGIRNTAKAVRDYQTAHGHAGTWNPQPGPMQKLDIPANLAKPSTSGLRYGDLSWWQWIGKWDFWKSTNMRGSCIVYKSSVSGIWAYEWMPVDIPADIGDDPHVKNLLEQLETRVKPKLHGVKKPAGKMKGGPIRRRRAQRKVLRRAPKKHEKFDDKAWQDAYDPWKKDAEKQLGDPTTSKNVGELEALRAAKSRTHIDPGTPDAVKERTKAAATVKHWVRYGKLYGWLRKTFDRVYVKLAGFADWIKKKVRKLAKSMGNSSFGNWIKAAALALFKVAKRLGAWAVSMIVDKLLDSLQEGVSNVLHQLAEAATPEAVKSKIEEVEALKATFEQMLGETTQKIEQALFGDKLALLEKIDEYTQIASTVSSIVSVVRWGIRIVACASPPLVGCLWNLAIAALEYAFTKIMETCWFQSKVLGWVRDSGIKQIIDFPTNAASAIATEANKLIPLPEGIGPLFAEIKVNQSEFNIKCGGGEGNGDGDVGDSGAEPPTEEQKALMALAKEVGDDKFEAFLEMAAKRAADYGVELTADRIKKLGPLLKNLTIDQIKKIAEKQPVDGIDVSVEEFLKSIATMTEAETQRQAERKIDYDKARNANRKFHREQIKWKPELFVKSGVAPDSKEFVDAIFDIQNLLGIKRDGMAGPRTTKLFYERNRQAKDGAYDNAVEMIERAEQDAKAAAERRKLVDELLKDEKVKQALDATFPKDAELKKDLIGFDWNRVPVDQFIVTRIAGRPVILIKTDAEHRLGAYFSFAEREFSGKKQPMMVKTSKFYALDKIENGEGISMSVMDRDNNTGLAFTVFRAQAQDTFRDSSNGLSYFSQFVEFQ